VHKVKVTMTAALAAAMVCVPATAGEAHGRPSGGGFGASPSNGAAYDADTTGPSYQVPFGETAMDDFYDNEFFAPTTIVGANDGCLPTRRHPYPVVLVHGTFENEGSNWVTLAPLLANAGYCVFAFNYGVTPGSFGGLVDGVGDIPTSAGQLASFVDQVLAQTGATQVDLVGHSQGGGVMPLWYIKFDGGASKVHELVGLAPSNHGTTVDGVVTLIQSLGLWNWLNGALDEIGYAGLVQQMTGSAIMTKLYAGGDTVPGPRYVVITTDHDWVVTPYENQFLVGPDVTNILLQDQCPDDPVSHVGMIEDWPALQNVLNELGDRPARDFQPQCADYGVDY